MTWENKKSGVRLFKQACLLGKIWYVQDVMYEVMALGSIEHIEISIEIFQSEPHQSINQVSWLISHEHLINMSSKCDSLSPEVILFCCNYQLMIGYCVNVYLLHHILHNQITLVQGPH